MLGSHSSNLRGVYRGGSGSLNGTGSLSGSGDMTRGGSGSLSGTATVSGAGEDTEGIGSWYDSRRSPRRVRSGL